jgi:antitoxin component of RelBE/YafQ-DinJ toxin-antitoxin module
MEMAIISIRIDRKVKETLSQQAHNEGRTLSNYIQLLMRNEVKRLEGDA